MVLNYNISFSIAALIIAIIVLIIVSLNYSTTNLVNKRYKYLLISVIALIALDIVTAITNDNASYVAKWVNMTLNAAYFFAGAVTSVLFLYYTISVALKKSTERTRQLFYIVNLSVLGIYLISLVVNGFTGFYYDFVADKYTHGPFYYGVNALAVLFVLEAVVLFIVKRREFNFRQLLSTTLFIASFFISFALQLFVFPEYLLSDFGISLGVLIIFFSIETPDYIKLMQTLNELNELKASLEIQVESRTKELDEEKISYEELTLETLSSLARVIDAKDHYTNGHSFRVAAYAKGMADLLNFSYNEAEQIYFAGLIHDVGKIGINESILTKKGKLSEKEFSTIQSHSALGGDILKGIKEFPIFEKVARSHHERYDGTGYPDKLKGEEIPYEARIVTICDTFDAMTSDRSYRVALSDKVAIEELIRCKGTQFDPKLVDVFLKLYSKYPDGIRNHVDELASSIDENTPSLNKNNK